jgi:hypothetical protein
MSKFRFTVEFEIDQVWIADGFFLTAETALEMLGAELNFANVGEELDARMVKVPNLERVAKAQGYSDAAHMKSENPHIDYSAGKWVQKIFDEPIA